MSAGSSSCEIPWETRHIGSSVTPVSEPPDPTRAPSGGLVSSGRGSEQADSLLGTYTPSWPLSGCNAGFLN